MQLLRWLLVEETLQLLEQTLNFSGFVVTDWDDLQPQDEASSFTAGLDITMSGAVSTEALSGISNATVDGSALRILTAMYSVGLFDRKDYGNWTRSVTSAAHYELAQSIAEQSTVLLLNRPSPLEIGPALPLDAAAPRRYAVIGSDSGVHGVGSGSAGQGDAHSQHGDRVINSAEGMVQRLAAGTKGSGSTVSNWTISWQQQASSCVGKACIMPVTQADIDSKLTNSRFLGLF